MVYLPVCGESGTNHHVDFGKSSGTPSCTCGDWSKTHFPCKQFFAIFIHNSTNSLPKSYLESPYLSTDVDGLAQVSVLPSSVFANSDMIADEQTGIKGCIGDLWCWLNAKPRDAWLNAKSRDAQLNPTSHDAQLDVKPRDAQLDARWSSHVTLMLYLGSKTKKKIHYKGWW